MITLLFYGGSSLLDRLIFWFTRPPYSHVAIAIDGQVVFEELGHGLVRHTGDDARAVIAAAAASKEIPVSDAGKAAVLAFARKLLAEHGGYAYDQLILDACQRAGLTVSNDGDGDRFVCSGFAGTCLALAGWRFNKDPRALTPRDLATAFQPLTTSTGS